jgi:DNA-binding Lrp family transcriptional regulator
MKLKIIGFYDKHGLKATRDAFGISKSTIARIIRYLRDKGKILNPNAKVSFYAKTGRIGKCILFQQ